MDQGQFSDPTLSVAHIKRKNVHFADKLEYSSIISTYISCSESSSDTVIAT